MGDVKKGKITGGKYCVFNISHTAETIEKAWNEIFSEVTKNGYTFDCTRPILERYAVKMVRNHYCEICIPIY